MNSTINTMKAHVSVRDYKAEVIPFDVIEKLLDAAQCSSSGNNVQSYSVIAIDDQDLKEKLAVLTNNKHVATAAYFLAFCADFNQLKEACDKHHQVLHSETMENLLMATVDTALLAQNLHSQLNQKV